MRVGYASINLTLAAQKIQVNRSMMKRTFLEKGIIYASGLALANFTDFEKIIDWNIQNNILFFRMSSDMMPWMSQYQIADLPDYEDIKIVLQRCGKKAAQNNLRLTYHPGPFNVLAANSEHVLTKTIHELRNHADIMDLLHLPQSHYAKINIHVGGAFGDKTAAMARFAQNFTLLPENVRKRLAVENDDKANMFSVQDLRWLHEQINIPITFDYFHHQFCTGGLSEQEALLAAVSTWPEDITPVVHFSSSKKKYEDPAAGATAHADYLYEPVNTYGQEVDIMFEAKAKELAVAKYLATFNMPASNP
ncbi:UV DNA damage repair endonuclease UvsE [Adhaeribacter rhizoryzae]|uniref:UV DNA damage repair endonuclease UvsE n=2 Tax=Adhaeribacter rhizoryzae TaxID=2607907 RepID=A0A5M6DKG4_9BACT|nr:UV DNA damage repair endonuclease UvsE [Adhaeribacter rhizoryzae]